MNAAEVIPDGTPVNLAVVRSGRTSLGYWGYWFEIVDGPWKGREVFCGFRSDRHKVGDKVRATIRTRKYKGTLSNYPQGVRS